MSIHVQISEEAALRLKKQQRNATLLSILSSFLIIIAVGLILGIFLLPNIVKESPVIVSYTSSLPQAEEVQKKTPTKAVSKPAVASSSVARVIAAQTDSSTAIPIPDTLETAPSLEFGNENDFGDAWSEEVATDVGGGFAGIPVTMRKRCSAEDRMERLLSEGGTPETEAAVLKALDWFQRTQKSDGSWTVDHPVAMTGFSLLAYLGHCETPQSPKYGETVLKGITYLVDVGMKNNGRLTDKDPTKNSWVYDHAIATYALAEAYTFCNQLRIEVPNLDVVVEKAGEMVMKGQNNVGGWLYKFEDGSEGDNSVGFWMIQALKACKHTGIWKDSDFTRYSREALSWLEKAQGKNGDQEGAIGYRGKPGKKNGLTGGGALCFQLWGRADSKEAKKALNYTVKNYSEFVFGDKDKGNLYHHYYNVQALINQGGPEWKAYNLSFRDNLLKAQTEAGTWPNLNGGHYCVNEHMSTSLSTLMLEAYYRFLPGTGEK